MTAKQLTYFERWYKHYPKKRARGRAETAFVNALKKNKDVPADEFVDKLIAAVELQRKSVDWQKDGGQFIPHPASWLNAKMWGDDIDIVRQPEIDRSGQIDVKTRQSQRDIYTEWIKEQPLEQLRVWGRKPQNHRLAWLVVELRPEIRK
jgi:hypothetical protein